MPSQTQLRCVFSFCMITVNTVSGSASCVSCSICKSVSHINCLQVPQNLRESAQKVLATLGWVCDSCRTSIHGNLQKLQSTVSTLTQEVACLQLQMKSLTETVPSNCTSMESASRVNSSVKSTSNTNVSLAVHKNTERHATAKVEHCGYWFAGNW